MPQLSVVVKCSCINREDAGTATLPNFKRQDCCIHVADTAHRAMWIEMQCRRQGAYLWNTLAGVMPTSQRICAMM